MTQNRIQVLTLVYWPLLLVGGTVQFFNPNDYETQLNIAKCMLALLDDYLEPGMFLQISLERNPMRPAYEIGQQVAKLVHETSKWVVVIRTTTAVTFKSYAECLDCGNKTINTANIIEKRKYNFKHHYHSVWKYHANVIITENIELFEQKLESMMALPNFLYRAKYIVLFSRVAEYDERVANKILQVMFKRGLFRMMVLVPHQTFDNVNMFRYRLNENNGTEVMCAHNTQLHQVDTCRHGNWSTFGLRLVPKPGAIRNFNNCVVNVESMKYAPFVIDSKSGFEIIMLHNIGSALNIHFNLSIDDEYTDWGQILPNGRWDGKLGVMKERRSIGVGNVQSTLEMLQSFSFTKTYFYETLVWVVPKAQEIPNWATIVVIFEPDLWYAVIAVLIAGGFLIFLFTKFTFNERTFLRGPAASFLMSFMATIGTAVATQPRTKFTRTVFMSICILNVILNCMYQSTLIFALTRPLYEEQIDSVDDILQSSLKIGGMEAYKDIFHVKGERRSMRIYNMFDTNAEINDTTDIWMDTVSRHRNYATVQGKLFVNYLLTKCAPLACKNNKPLVFIVREDVYSYPIQIVMNRGYLLLDHFDRVITGMVSGGLVQKWAGDYFNNRRTRSMLSDQNGAVYLSLQQMEGPFGILIVGILVSMLVFGCEVGVGMVTRSHWYQQLEFGWCIGYKPNNSKDM